jgi:hypothetical protein
MIKMPKMQKIPNLFLFIGRDHQLVYFTMLSPTSVKFGTKLFHLTRKKGEI